MVDIKNELIDTLIVTIADDVKRSLIGELASTIKKVNAIADNDPSYYIYSDAVALRRELSAKLDDLCKATIYEIPEWAEERFVGKFKQTLEQILRSTKDLM